MMPAIKVRTFDFKTHTPIDPPEVFLDDKWEAVPLDTFNEILNMGYLIHWNPIEEAHNV
jgi:hypothetical protein